MTRRAKHLLATLRRQITGRVTIRRGSGETAESIQVRARVAGFQPDELVGDIDQGHRRAIVLAEDVTMKGGIQKGDRLMWNGTPLAVEVVDDATGNVDGTPVAIYLRVKG